MTLLLLALLAAGRIVITEVMSNPAGPSGAHQPEDRNEFVELYNPGDEAVDLYGWSLDDGDSRDILVAWTDPAILAEAPELTLGSTWLPPKWYAVVLDAEYTDSLAEGGWVRPYRFGREGRNVLALTTGNTTLGDGLAGNDPVTIASPRGDTTTYGTPFNPDDSIPASPPDGVSWERLDPEGPDAESNWALCPDSAGCTPGAPAAAGSMPDLAVAALELAEPSAYTPGAPFDLLVTVANPGFVAAEDWNLEVFVDEDGDGAPDPSGENRTVQGFRLAPGADSALNLRFTAPRITADLWARLDCPGDADTIDNRRRLLLDPGSAGRHLALGGTGFSPNGDGFEDSLAVVCRLPAPGGRLRVLVFNLAGRQVRELWNGTPAAQETVINWNGREASGHPAPVGIYAVWLRWTGPGAAVEEQLPVALYR